MKNLSLTLLAVLFYILHQDVWLWTSARPLLLGALPIGLSYHVAFSLASSLFFCLLVALAWPQHLEKEGEARDKRGDKREQGR
jgi:hypothetical protein